MATTTKKHDHFIKSSSIDKPVSSLPGIGAVAANKLKAASMETAEQVLGKFLMMGRNKQKFISWLKETAGSKERDATNCADALVEWTKVYLK